MAKKPSKVRTGTHSAGGKKRYTDVKRRTTKTATGWKARAMTTPSGRAHLQRHRDEDREGRRIAAARNKALSTPTGRYHAGSAERSSADVSNRRRDDYATKSSAPPAMDPNSAINRKKRAAVEAKKAAASLRRWALEADISANNPPGFQ